jgi:hypothetical protein
VNRKGITMSDKEAIHPAKRFGEWLKSKRRERSVVARVFAGRIRLAPAEYAEVEAGIVSWIEERQEVLIPVLLDLSEEEIAEFSHKLFLARGASPLQFKDIFTREQLSPARCCTVDGNQLTVELQEQILNAVFTPLQ